MPFEKFEDAGSGRGTAGPKLSLRKSGSIGINNAALEEFFDENDGAVVMYYDEDENQVGMKPVEDKDSEDGAYTLSRSESGGAVTPSAFMNRHGLVPERTEQYKPNKVKVNQNLELVAFTAGADSSSDFLGYYGNPDEAEADD